MSLVSTKQLIKNNFMEIPSKTMLMSEYLATEKKCTPVHCQHKIYKSHYVSNLKILTLAPPLACSCVFNKTCAYSVQSPPLSHKISFSYAPSYVLPVCFILFYEYWVKRTTLTNTFWTISVIIISLVSPYIPHNNPIKIHVLYCTVLQVLAGMQRNALFTARTDTIFIVSLKLRKKNNRTRFVLFKIKA